MHLVRALNPAVVAVSDTDDILLRQALGELRRQILARQDQDVLKSPRSDEGREHGYMRALFKRYVNVDALVFQ